MRTKKITYREQEFLRYQAVLPKRKDTSLVLRTVIVWDGGIRAKDGFVEVGSCDTGVGNFEGLDGLRANDNFAASRSVEARHRWVETYIFTNVSFRVPGVKKREAYGLPHGYIPEPWPGLRYRWT